MPVDASANFPSRVLLDKTAAAPARLVEGRVARARTQHPRAAGRELGAVPADAARRRKHRPAQLRQVTGRGLQRRADRAGRVLPRPGADRHRERAAVQRDAGGAAAAEGLGRGAGRHQQFGVRRAAGVREDPRQLQAPVRRRRTRRAAGRRAGPAGHRRLPRRGPRHRRRHLPGAGGTHPRRPRAARAARDALARPDRRRRRARACCARWPS